MFDFIENVWELNLDRTDQSLNETLDSRVFCSVYENLMSNESKNCWLKRMRENSLWIFQDHCSVYNTSTEEVTLTARTSIVQ